MKVKKYIGNEKGSGTVIIMVCMVLAAVFFGLIFFDFSNVFINKRVTQTGADAAALAAAKTANEHMRIYLQEETQEKLEELGKQWEDFQEANEDATLSEFVSSIEQSLGKNMPSDVRQWLQDHSTAVKSEPAMKFFFEDNEVSKMSCDAVEVNLGDARSEAESFAKENQSDELKDMKFIKEDFRIYVETERSGKFITVSDEGIPAIVSDSSVRIGEPLGYEGKIKCN